MQARTNTLLILVYGAVALIVVLLVFLLGSQYQRAEKLISELDETERQNERRRVTQVEAQPRRSMRPALIRLERLLEARTQKVRDQKNQLSEQISGREKLQQKHKKLSLAYDRLRDEHELLLNEVSFYLNAAEFVSADLSSSPDSPTSNEPAEAAVDEEADADPPQANVEAEFAEVEATRLREELVALTALSQRDAVVAGYASQAMVEMGDTAIPLLTAILSDEQADARAWAAWVLGQMGSSAAVATPDLEPLLNDDNEEVVEAASEALRLIER